MPRVAKKVAAAGGAPDLSALGISLPKMPGGAPGMRKPTRGALGGAAPRGARGKLPPTIASAGARGGKKAAAPKRKVKK